MKDIIEILNKQPVSLMDLMNCFEIIKQKGDVAVIKFDGDRKDKQYTVFISFPKQSQKNLIRADEDELITALVKVLSVYTGKRKV